MQVSRGSEKCVSWNFTTNSWTGDGCITERDGDTVTCQCNHLTNFAVLVVSNQVMKNVQIIYRYFERMRSVQLFTRYHTLSP